MHTVGHVHLEPQWKPGAPVTARGKATEHHLVDNDPANRAGVIGYRLETLRPVIDASSDLVRTESLAELVATPRLSLATTGSLR